MNSSSIGDIVFGVVVVAIVVTAIVNNGMNHRAEIRAKTEAAARADRRTA